MRGSGGRLGSRRADTWVRPYDGAGWAAMLFVLGACAPAQSITPRLAPATITVGDLLTYTVDVPLAPGESVVGPGAEASFGKWEVRDYRTQSGPGKTALVYTLTAFETGTLDLPPLTVSISQASGKTRTVRTAAAKVTVASVLQGEDTQPADIVPPLSLREKPLDLGLRIVVVVVALALLVLLARFLWLRRRRRRAAEQSRPDPPDVTALKALEALRAARLPEAGRVKAHYSELSDILRAYLAARWGLRTLEETTSQVLAQLHGNDRYAEYVPVVEDLLREADLVKFAKARPGVPACWSAVDGVERLVRDTAVALNSQPETRNP